MDAKSIFAILEQDPWFAGLEPGLKRDIVRLGQTCRFRNSLIYAMGDEPNGLFAILSGEARVSYSASDGRLALLLIARAGSWIGETSMLDRQSRYSEALAVGAVTALRISPASFAAIVGGQADRYQPFVRLLCDRHRSAMGFIASLGALPAKARIAQRLIDLGYSRRTPRSKGIAIDLSQDDLAAAVGVSRQTVNTALRQWKRAGIISLSYRQIIVEDWIALLRTAKIS